jgi:hypothetical protein
VGDLLITNQSHAVHHDAGGQLIRRYRIDSRFLNCHARDGRGNPLRMAHGWHTLGNAADRHMEFVELMNPQEIDAAFAQQPSDRGRFTTRASKP